MLWCTYRYSYSYAVTGDSGESPAHRHSLLAVAADGSVIRGGDSDSERRRRPHRRFASVNALLNAKLRQFFMCERKGTPNRSESQ